MNLSLLSVLLGVAVGTSGAFALIKPDRFGPAARQFPRSLTWGYALMALATGWFLYYLSLESVSDFIAYKPAMYIGFSVLGVLTCFFLSDFLAVRGLALVLLLLAKAMLDTARWHDSSWRLVIAVWAYVLIFFGMWLTISPWRLRDMISWATANASRVKMMGAGRLVFGLFIIILGLFVF